jgi:hypothetical protein
LTVHKGGLLKQRGDPRGRANAPPDSCNRRFNGVCAARMMLAPCRKLIEGHIPVIPLSIWTDQLKYFYFQVRYPNNFEYVFWQISQENSKHKTGHSNKAI